MAIPELLVADTWKSGTPPQVYELVGGTTLNAIGGPCLVNAFDGARAATEGNACNQVIDYRGEIFIIYNSALNVMKIDGYNRGTGLWTNRHTTTTNNTTGLFIANTGTVQRLFTLGNQGGANTFIDYTDDGVTWSTTASLGFHSGSGGSQNPAVMFNNKLYAVYARSGYRVYEADPIALTYTELSGGPAGNTNSTRGDLCVHDDRLFLLALDDATLAIGSNYALYEFTGSGFSLNTQITNDSRGGAAAIDEGERNLFKDPSTNNLIALCNGAGSGGVSGTTNNGSTAFQLVPSGSVFTPTEITNTVIPAALRPGARATANALEDRWYSVTVNDTAPGTPEVYIFIAEGPAPGTGYAVYAWTDASTLLASPAAGPTTAFSIPQFKAGGGDRINKGAGNQCAIEFGTPVLGGYQISYRVYGTQSSQNVTGYYSLDQEAPSTQMTFSAQTGGSGITGGNTVTGITGDDGTTLFTVTWNTVTDGVANGDAATMMLDINP